MPRPKQCRRIGFTPLVTGFKPIGIPCPAVEEITLQYDEYETIRLLDYEGLNQEQAAERMNVSRPTLTRIYENARKTIAKAFVEGKMIVIRGGNVDFCEKRQRCRKCSRQTEGFQHHGLCKNCPDYNQTELTTDENNNL